MGLILRSSSLANAGDTVTVKGSPLEYTEGDGNFVYLLTNMSGSNIKITGQTNITGSTTISSGSLLISGSTTTSSSLLQIKGISTSTSSYQIYTANNNNTTNFYVRNDGLTYSTKLQSPEAIFFGGLGTCIPLITYGGSGNVQFRFTSGDLNANIYNSSLGGFTFSTFTAANKVYISGNGNLILNSLLDEGYQLSVSGSARITNGLTVTGSINVSQTLNLTAQNPLPTGQLGNLAVSSSALYFHDGLTWKEVSLVP